MRLCAFVGRRVGNCEGAEGIVQNVFVEMQRNIAALPAADRLDAWTLGIARYALPDYYPEQSSTRP